MEHLGGHEVAKVMESEVIGPSGAAHRDEVLGHEARLPRPTALLVGSKDEAILGGLHSTPPLSIWPGSGCEAAAGSRRLGQPGMKPRFGGYQYLTVRSPPPGRLLRAPVLAVKVR
jgi:hypothetical protein